MAKNYEDKGVMSYEWNVLNFYGSISRWCVPIFVMISGALFLNRDYSLKEIYGRKIFRLVCAFMFWSFIYALLSYIASGDISDAALRFLKGHFHMWFIFMIIGLYMTVPILKRIAESKYTAIYFLVLSFLFAFFLPQVADTVSLFSQSCGKFLKEYVSEFKLYLVMGYTGYFILGYIMDKMIITVRMKKLIYCAGVAGAVVAVMLPVVSFMAAKCFYVSYEYLNVNVLLESIAVFVFIRLNTPGNAIFRKIIKALSRYSFGAYMVHIVFSASMREAGFSISMFNPALSVPFVSFAVFVLSFSTSAVLNHIPILNRYIV